MSAGRSAAFSVAGEAETSTASTEDRVDFDETDASLAGRFPIDATTAAAAATSDLASAGAAVAMTGASVQFLRASEAEDRDLRGGETGGVIETVASRDSEAGGCGGGSDGVVFLPPFFDRCLWWPCPELALFLEDDEEGGFPPAASTLERPSAVRSLSNAAAQAVRMSVRIRLAELVAWDDTMTPDLPYRAKEARAEIGVEVKTHMAA